MFHRILVAYDGSDSARHAFEKAIELAKEFRSEVFALAVVQLPEPPLVAEAGVMLEDATAHLQKDFDAFTATAQAADLRFGSRAVLGHPADQIVEWAKEQKADLIVMGHRGKGIIERWLLGSVSKRVVSYAHCSVLIVR